MTHPRSQALLAACVAISPGTNRTGTPQIVVFTGSKRPTAVDKKCCVSLFFQKEWRSYIFCIFVFYSLYSVKYILLGPTTGGYSHSLLCFMPGSYYFSDILGFTLHTVISVNRQYACARRLSNARIRTTHSKVLHQIMASCMDEEGLLKRTHSKSLEKLDKAGLNLKQK